EEHYFFESGQVAPKIVDCGSHVGFSILYFKRLYPNAEVIAFEPCRANYEIARRNIQANGLENVTIHQLALEAFDGEAQLAVPANDSLGATLTNRRSQTGESLEVISVPCTRLSHFLNEPVDLLKLDIEGVEDAVLIESAACLKHVKNIV